MEYRRLLADRRTRRLMIGLGVSALGDGMSAVTIAWLALRIGDTATYVGLAVAAYTLPGVIGALAFGRFLLGRPARTLVLASSALRAGCLGAVALLGAFGALAPAAYVVLLAGSSLLTAWGNAGKYTMLAELGGPDGRLAINSLASAQVSFAVIVGPLVAGGLVGWVGPIWLVAIDAATFAVLGVVAWLTPTGADATAGPVDRRAAESGFRLLRRRDLLSLTVLTWVFFFLYGPVEVALPVYVAHDLGADARLLGAYWTAFGVGALVATLAAGLLRARDMRRVTLAVVAGWGLCLVPFGFASVAVTLGFFALGGLVYGPFVPLTYALFQSATSTANLPAVLAARSSVVMLSTPLGVAVGGPVVGTFGAAQTLAISGVATVVLAVAGVLLWPRQPAREEVAGVGYGHLP